MKKKFITRFDFNGRLRSFTLTEILVATLLSSILLVFVVTVFSFFLNRLRSESNAMDKMDDLFNIETFLSEKMQRCDSVRIENNHLQFYSNDEMESYVEFNDSLIVINLNEVSDTFRLSHSEIRYSYLSDETKLISKVDFAIDLRSFMAPVSLLKEYEGVVTVNSKISER